MHPADQLLKTLGHQIVTFQTFPDHPQAQGHPQIIHAPHHVAHKRLTQINKAGHGIFYMVNKGDHQGRRTENVTAITAYFVDLDGTPLYDHWPLPPTAIVESSPGRYHAYWRVTNAPLAMFPHVQKHVAILLAGDEKCHDLPRVLRLPGYTHQKAEPFASTLLHCTTDTYTHEAFINHFAVPPLPPARKPPAPEILAYMQRYQKAPRNGHKPQGRTLDTAAERIATAPEGHRNHTLYTTACAVANQVKTGEIDRTEAEHILTIAAETSGLDPRETQATIRSAMRHA